MAFTYKISHEPSLQHGLRRSSFVITTSPSGLWIDIVYVHDLLILEVSQIFVIFPL